MVLQNLTECIVSLVLVKLFVHLETKLSFVYSFKNQNGYLSDNYCQVPSGGFI